MLQERPGGPAQRRNAIRAPVAQADLERGSGECALFGGWRVVILVKHGLTRSTMCLITGLAPSGQYPIPAPREP